jgi:hypothetical protein
VGSQERDAEGAFNDQCEKWMQVEEHVRRKDCGVSWPFAAAGEASLSGQTGPYTRNLPKTVKICRRGWVRSRNATRPEVYAPFQVDSTRT